MNQIEEFIPTAGYPNLKKTWRIYGVVFVALLIPTLFIGTDLTEHFLAAAFVFVMLSVLLVIDREAVHVIISNLDGTFTYRTLDCFGKERDTVVFLSNAKIS
jgi:hypothetical protein